MIKKLAIGMMLFCAAIMPTQTVAHDIPISSVSGLVANCTYQSNDEAENEFHLGMCLGFLKAIMNTHSTHGETFCIPQSMDNGQLVDVLRQGLYALVGEYADAPSHMIVGAIYEAAFPCD